MGSNKKYKKIKLRNAVKDDIESITRVYNHAVESTTATFDIKPRTLKSQEKWFNEHTGRYSVIVAEDNKKVIGWASLSRWSERQAYNDTAGISIYVDKGNQRKGVGNLLMAEIIRLAKKNKFHIVLAGIAGDNKVSIHLHEKYGFFHTGVLKEAGFKFNKYIDVHLMQLMLD